MRQGNWRYAAENGIDEGHAKYLHRTARWTMFRKMPAWTAGPHMAPSEDGEWLMRDARRGSIFEDDYPRLGRWPPTALLAEAARGHVASARHPPARHPAAAVQRGWTRLRDLRARSTRTTTCYPAVLVTRARGLAALQFRLRYWLYVRWLYHGQFNGQDQWMIELMEIAARAAVPAGRVDHRLAQAGATRRARGAAPHGGRPRRGVDRGGHGRRRSRGSRRGTHERADHAGLSATPRHPARAPAIPALVRPARAASSAALLL